MSKLAIGILFFFLGTLVGLFCAGLMQAAKSSSSDDEQLDALAKLREEEHKK